MQRRNHLFVHFLFKKKIILVGCIYFYFFFSFAFWWIQVPKHGYMIREGECLIFCNSDKLKKLGGTGVEIEGVAPPIPSFPLHLAECTKCTNMLLKKPLREYTYIYIYFLLQIASFILFYINILKSNILEFCIIYIFTMIGKICYNSLILTMLWLLY